MGQIRFQDNCFEYAANSIPSDILTNLDSCKAKGSELWVPETSAEHFFVAQSFPSAETNNYYYHLGILKYSPKKGFYGVDNSFHVGSTYFTLSDDLKDLVLETLIIDESWSCLIYNKLTNTWQLKIPCESAVGVCKSKLGKMARKIF